VQNLKTVINQLNTTKTPQVSGDSSDWKWDIRTEPTARCDLYCTSDAGLRHIIVILLFPWHFIFLFIF